uniref:Uncharacterized protein n=1 Tax=Cacopsylla melanoneura TaxID=428564 RepID=A0A8D8QLA6_9HEMI
MKPCCLPLCCVLVTFLVCQSLAQNNPNSAAQNKLLDDVDVLNADIAEDSNRIRRSGLTGLINKKLHFIGHLSGSSSGSSSHSGHSSGHHGDEHHHGYGYETEHHEYPVHGYEHHEEKGHKLFDYKKHVLAALFQAVKAITGGVVALKGQVLKIGGHLITWKGKFLVKKGDQISDFGKEVATKALLSPPTVHHHHTVYSPPTSFGSSAYASAQASHSSSHANDIYHHHHAAPHHYVAPAYSAPTPTYSAPSGGGSYPYAPSGVAEYDYNRDFGSKVTRAVSASSNTQTGTAQNSLNNDQLHAGLLILKPIQVPKDHPSKYQYAQQALLKQTGLSGIKVNTAGNTGMNYNVGSYNTPQSNSYFGQGQPNYQSNNYLQQSNSYQLPSDSYNSASNSYQGPITSYGTPAPAVSQFIKVPSASEYRSSFPAFAPTPLSDAKLPSEESSPFDFLYKKSKKSQESQTSQERQDTKTAESEINENALSALNVLYQQTESQNKDQRETRHTSEEPLNDETLKKILDALFSAKDKTSKQESSDPLPSA